MQRKRKKTQVSENQYSLDFSSDFERKRHAIRESVREGIAKFHKVTIFHEQLLLWMLNVEHNNGGPLRKSWPSIGKEYWCSPATAKRTAKALREWGMIKIAADEYATGANAPNLLTLHWAGIKEWFQRAQESRRRKDTGLPDRTPGLPDRTPGLPDRTPGLPDRTSSTFLSSSCSTFLPPPPHLQGDFRSPRGVVGVEESSSVAIADQSATAVSRATAWDQAIAKLRSTGLRATDYVVSEARCRRMPPEVLAQAADFYAEHRQAWAKDGQPNPGVITFWVRQYTAGDDPTDLRLWPSQSAAFLRTIQKHHGQADSDRASRAYAIIRGGRAVKKSEEQIAAELAAAGLEWPR